MDSVARIQHELALHQGKQREIQQHAPRPARMRFTVKTTGIGETRLTGRKAINFGALLLEEPSFSWGVVALQTIGREKMPLCTAMVLNYLRNDNGLYVGADMGFRVDSIDPHIRLQFSLTFEASALRSTVGGGGDQITSTPTSPTVFRR